jgi:hypothetical protein
MVLLLCCPACAACAREELAPLALDAYPEAYLDFKHALLMLVQPPQPQQQAAAQQQQQVAAVPAKAEWSLEARQQLAESLHHTMLLELGEGLLGGGGLRNACGGAHSVLLAACAVDRPPTHPTHPCNPLHACPCRNAHRLPAALARAAADLPAAPLSRVCLWRRPHWRQQARRRRQQQQPAGGAARGVAGGPARVWRAAV